MSDELPDGFVLQTPSPATPSGDRGGSTPPPLSDAPHGDPGTPSQLPPGFALSEASVIPHAADRLKQGVSNLMGMIGGGATSAVNYMLKSRDDFYDKALEKEHLKPMAHLSSPDPVGGVGQVTRGWEGLLGVQHIPIPKDLQGGDSKANEYIGNIAEFVGGALAPGLGAVANAAKGKKLITALTIAAGETAAGLSTTEAKEWGGQMASYFGLSEAEGQQIGAMVGGFAGPNLVNAGAQALTKSMSASKAAAKAANVTGLSPEAQKAAASTMLMKDIEDSLKHAPHSEANLARSLQLAERVPGWAPTAAQASNAPGLVAMQREVAKKSAESLAKAAAADQRNIAAIARYREAQFPGNPALALEPTRHKLAANRQIMGLEAERNIKDLRTLSDQYHRAPDNEAIGDALRSKYWSARKAAKIVSDMELSGVYATAKRVGIVEDMTDIRDAIKKITTADAQTFQDMPPLFTKVLKEYPAATAAKIERVATTPAGSKRPIFRTETTKATPGRSEASFEELHSLYKQASKDQADAVMAGNSAKAHYMGLVKDQLSKKVAKYSEPQYGELTQKFSDYNANYTKYARTFKEGAGGEVSKRTRAGLSTDSEDLVSKVFLQSADKKKGLQDFFAIHGDDPEATELLRSGILDNFSKATMRSGTFDPKAAAGWLKRHETAMGELPELRARLQDSVKAGQDLVNRQLMLQKQRKIMDNKLLLTKLAKSDKPEEAVQRALRDPKQMKALLVGAITTEGKQSIARAIVDEVSKQPNALDYIAKNEATLKPVMEQLGKGHWSHLSDIAEMEQISKRVKAPTEVELSKLQDVGEKTIGTSVKGMLSRLRNMDKPMGVSKEYMVLDVGGRWFYKVRSEELARLREAAMFDPDTAALLSKLGRKAGAPTKQELLDLKRLSFNAGVVATSEAVAEGRRK